MSELDDAIALLERALARLESAADRTPRPVETAPAAETAHSAETARAADVATEVAGRLDAALLRLGQLLEREE